MVKRLLFFFWIINEILEDKQQYFTGAIEMIKRLPKLNINNSNKLMNKISNNIFLLKNKSYYVYYQLNPKTVQ